MSTARLSVTSQTTVFEEDTSDLPKAVVPITVPKPRHQLTKAELNSRKPLREGGRLVKRIPEKQLLFEDSTLVMDPAAEKLVMNIGQCLREYFELEFVVVGHVGLKEAAKLHETHIQKLAYERARLVEREIYLIAECAFVRIDARGTRDNFEKGMVTLEVSATQVLDVQGRLDLVMRRRPWDFAPGEDQISPMGRRTAELMSDVLREAPNCRCVIVVPRSASALANRRSQAIAAAIRDAGVSTPVVLRTSMRPEERATVLLEDLADGHQTSGWSNAEEKDPSDEILDILSSSPDLFQPRSADLAAHAVPVMRRIAAVLENVTDRVVVVESYTGRERNGPEDGKVVEVMAARAESLVAALQGEGVKIPCRSDIFNGPYPEQPHNTRPVLVITLEDPNEGYNSEFTDRGVCGCCLMGNGYI